MTFELMVSLSQQLRDRVFHFLFICVDIVLREEFFQICLQFHGVVGGNWSGAGKRRRLPRDVAGLELGLED